MTRLTWKAFEENVKLISSFIWNCNANKETIKGINFDCVLKPKEDHWIIVEITENMTLNKVRSDIAKFASCRLSLISGGIYPEFYLVMNDDPTNSMQVTGEENKIKVLSYTSFSSMFINYETYFHVRTQRSFGSSVDPISGEPDKQKYTPVFYENLRTKQQIDIKGITRLLSDNKRIILIGNYGTGKSRCIRELFNILGQKKTSNLLYPIAINLKDNWGTRKAEEIIRRHFDDLGLKAESDSIIKIINSGSILLLLDGFDEIGTQAWSDDPVKLKQIRSTSLSGTKDLIQKTKGALIISGREHYFKNEKEMFELLGLDQQETVVLKCKDEFTDEEMENYLKSLSNVIDLPFWLPKRPIICQIINSLEIKSIERIFVDSSSPVEFWKTLILKLCEREARIHTILDSNTIYKIFLEIGQMTRTKTGNIGPISVSEINKAFEIIVRSYPIDDSAVMLQRLPALGRISSESNDRQFIDYYILDGLRADNLIGIINENKTDVFNEKWFNPLQKLGIEIVAKHITDNHNANYFIEYLKKYLNSDNKVLLGDIIATLIHYSTKHTLDLGGIILSDTHISIIDLSSTMIDNFIITNSIIEQIDITNCCCTRIAFKDCIINKVYGLSSLDEKPTFLNSNEISSFEKESMRYFDKKGNLNPSCMIFLALIKKLFLFGGKFKTEKELINSFGNKTDKLIAHTILKILVNEKIISKSIENNENVYIAKGHNRPRIQKILVDLNNSKDNLWRQIKNINDSTHKT